MKANEKMKMITDELLEFINDINSCKKKITPKMCNIIFDITCQMENMRDLVEQLIEEKEENENDN